MSDISFIRPDEFWRTLGLRAQQTVAHLGCGPGFYILPAAKFVGSSGKVIGVDVRTDMLAEVENRARRENLTGIVKTIRANLEATGSSGIAEQSCDWVLVANILHQSDPTKILAEAKRIVRSTGSVVVVEWDVVATPMGPPPDKRITQADVLAIAQTLGLSVAKQFAPSPYHYGIILKASL